MRKRRVPRKIKFLLTLNAILLACVCYCSFLLIHQLQGQPGNPRPIKDHQHATTAVAQAPKAPPLEEGWEQLDRPAKIPILMYHSVHHMAASEAANANLIVSPELFASHLQALQEAGYYTLTPAEAYRILSTNQVPKGRKLVWLTFDDGVGDFYTVVYPLLKQYQMTATNNIISGFSQAEKENVLTFPQIQEMKSAGLTFESHTVSHPDLANSSKKTQETELTSSKKLLDKKLDQKTSVITYPSGHYSKITMDLAKKAGYKMGLTTESGIASKADGLYALKRLRVLPSTTPEDLLAMMETN